MSNKIIVRVAGIRSSVLIFSSFKELKKHCSSNGANLDPKECFTHNCKPSICVNFFSETCKCKRKDCPVLKVSKIKGSSYGKEE
jgi:hypothetical protein